MALTQERIAELRALPNRDLLEEIFHIAGFEKVNLSKFNKVKLINPGD